MKMYFPGIENYSTDDVQASQEFTLIELLVLIGTGFILMGAVTISKLKKKIQSNANISEKTAKILVENTTNKTYALPFDVCYKAMNDTGILIEYVHKFLVSKDDSNMIKAKEYITKKMRIELDEHNKVDKSDKSILLSDKRLPAGKSLKQYGWDHQKLITFYSTDFQKWATKILELSTKVDDIVKRQQNSSTADTSKDKQLITAKNLVNSTVYLTQEMIQTLTDHHTACGKQ